MYTPFLSAPAVYLPYAKRLNRKTRYKNADDARARLASPATFAYPYDFFTGARASRRLFSVRKIHMWSVGRRGGKEEKGRAAFTAANGVSRARVIKGSEKFSAYVGRRRVRRLKREMFSNSRRGFAFCSRRGRDREKLSRFRTRTYTNIPYFAKNATPYVRARIHVYAYTGFYGQCVRSFWITREV